jgi:hypothetical protein
MRGRRRRRKFVRAVAERVLAPNDREHRLQVGAPGSSTSRSFSTPKPRRRRSSLRRDPRRRGARLRPRRHLAAVCASWTPSQPPIPPRRPQHHLRRFRALAGELRPALLSSIAVSRQRSRSSPQKLLSRAIRYLFIFPILAHVNVDGLAQHGLA